MQGLTLCERFYYEYGEPMLQKEFPHLLPHIAVGIIGSGSECFGFDDAISRDHDFDAGFCLFLPDEDTVSRAEAFRLERAYAALPREYMGVTRQRLSPTGGARRGVRRLSDLLLEKTGTPDGRLCARDFFFLPEASLAELTNGKIFFDGSGTLTKIRNRLCYLPEDVRRKKLAGALLLMGQAGEYNFPRSLSRADHAAAQLSVIEFVKNALHSIFLLNYTYLPYYKWQFRALRDLPALAALASPLYSLISAGNEKAEAEEKMRLIAHIARKVEEKLNEEELSRKTNAPLEAHAYAVNDSLSSPELRNLHILYGV